MTHAPLRSSGPETTFQLLINFIDIQLATCVTEPKWPQRNRGRLTPSAVLCRLSGFQLRCHKEDSAFRDDTGREDNDKCQQISDHLEDLDRQLDDLLVGERSGRIFRRQNSKHVPSFRVDGAPLAVNQ